MSKCSGNCNDCNDKKEKTPTTQSFPFRKEVDISEFLEPIPKPDQDDTPLDYPCRCEWESRNIKRYMCLPCIKTWVEAVPFETAMKEVDRLEKKGKKVAAERIRDVAEYRKWKGPIDDASCCSNVGCRDCSCNPTGEDLSST